MKSQYFSIAALVLALLVLCLPVSEATASSDLTVSLSRDRAPSVVSAPSDGGVVMGTQGDDNGGDDNEGDPDEWGEGNGVKIYGMPDPPKGEPMMVSRGMFDGLLAWMSHLLGVLSQWSR